MTNLEIKIQFCELLTGMKTSELLPGSELVIQNDCSMMGASEVEHRVDLALFYKHFIQLIYKIPYQRAFDIECFFSLVGKMMDIGFHFDDLGYRVEMILVSNEQVHQDIIMLAKYWKIHIINVKTIQEIPNCILAYIINNNPSVLS